MTLREYNIRVEGYLLRTWEISNLGIRRLTATVYNGFQSFGKNFVPRKEESIWPMTFDKFFKQPVQKSEDLYAKHENVLKQIWPDAKSRK